jgi:hypothetical protein
MGENAEYVRGLLPVRHFGEGPRQLLKLSGHLAPLRRVEGGQFVEPSRPATSTTFT